MKKLALGALLWLIVCWPTWADGGPFYFPIIYGNPCNEAAMSNWKVIFPTATTNKALNPSFETTGNFTAEAGTTVTRVTTFQHYGLYSARVETNANNEGIEITLSALANAIHYVTVRVRGTLPTAWDWSLNDSTFTSPTLLETIDGDWKLYGLQFPATQANGSVKLSIHQNGAGSGDLYLDGIQVEENTTWTTYCDGSQEGCEWNGAPNASTSSRSADSRAGGLVQDLDDDYGLNVNGMSGTGTAPQELFVDSYSQLPGGELNARKVNSRVITLTGTIIGDDEADFYAKKQALELLFDPDGVPEDENGEQPIRLRFNGAVVHKEIAAFYEGGLEASITADMPCAWEPVALRFLADDPYWHEIGESAVVLDTNDTASTFRTVAARLRSTGQWSVLGPPNASGTYTIAYTFAEDATYIYIGGDFLNFDNIANADYIVRYNKQTGVYSAMGTGGAGGAVVKIVIGPNGEVVAGGQFTSMGGVANTARIASWNGSAWSALGTGASAIVRDLVYTPTGTLVAVGDFLLMGGVANTVRIASWDGSVWTPLGTGLNSSTFAVAVDSSGAIYAGGSFTDAGGVAVDGIAKYSGGAWSDIDGGFNFVQTRDIVVSPTGILYAAGTWDTGGGGAADFIASYNGNVWTPLGTGANGSVFSLALTPDNKLLAGGTFTSMGGVALSDRVASWNGYSWSHLDIDLPGSPTVYALHPGKYVDPVVPQRYDLYLGFDTTGTGAFAGKVTATNDGTAPAYPKIIYTRSGGTSATLQALKNERSGLELLFNWSLQNGETLTIDLAPTKKSISSSTGLPAQNALLANSDLGDWALLNGDNNVTSLVSEVGSPTVTAYMLWKDTYKSQN